MLLLLLLRKRRLKTEQCICLLDAIDILLENRTTFFNVLFGLLSLFPLHTIVPIIIHISMVYCLQFTIYSKLNTVRSFLCSSKKKKIQQTKCLFCLFIITFEPIVCLYAIVLKGENKKNCKRIGLIMTVDIFSIYFHWKFHEIGALCMRKCSRKFLKSICRHTISRFCFFSGWKLCSSRIKDVSSFKIHAYTKPTDLLYSICTIFIRGMAKKGT